MFASMFKLLFNKCEKKAQMAICAIEFEIAEVAIKDTKHLLSEINKLKKNVDNGGSCSVSEKNIINTIEILQDILSHLFLPSSMIGLNVFPNHLIDDSSVEYIDTKSEVNSIRKKYHTVLSTLVEYPNTKRIVNQINNLQCLFTWNIKPNNKKNVILRIWNKYGKYNLNISSSEFTLERFIGSLIISYEYFHKGETELAQMKIWEIGKWLEELDKGTDEFYLSINTGLQHIIKASFIHMLYRTNLIEECKWFLDDIFSFANMDSKSRASVHAIRAAVLIEYGDNLLYFTKACDMAKKACHLDRKTSQWFYIHSLALTAQRHFSNSHDKSIPANDEIKAIHQAILLSNRKNPLFVYHKLVIDRDSAVGNFYKNKNKIKDKSIFQKYLQGNRNTADMVKTIINMNPRDPHLVVKCARTFMTLPTMVQDFNLGVQYLKKAFQMTQNDVTVLKAIEKAVEAYNDMS